MARIVIFGAGEIAELADFYFTRDSEHEVVGFAVDSQYCENDIFLGRPLISISDVLERYPPNKYKMFIALSYRHLNKLRAEKYRYVKELGYELVSYVSSRCTYLSDILPGDNCFILEDSTIQPFVKIGNNVTLWSGTHIAHGSSIGDHCFIAPRVAISGNVCVGEYCFIGVNATLRNSLIIAPETLIGAGAVILENTVEKGVYIAPRPYLSHRSSDHIEL